MKSIEDTIGELDERIASEEDILKDLCDDGFAQTIGAAMSSGYLKALRQLKEWVLL